MDSVNYTPPVRRSMNDEQLAALLNQPHSDEASMLAAMQLLEQQTALRNEDIRLEAMWAVEMQVINTTESIAALNAFRSGASLNDRPALPSSAHVDPAPATLGELPAVERFAAPASEPNAVFTPQVSVSKPVSLFDEIASVVKTDAVQEDAVHADATVSAPSATADQYPLVPVAPAPDISVAAADLPTSPAFEPIALVAQPDFVDVEQRVTEFEEARESGIDGSNVATSAVYERDYQELEFDELLEPAPIAASDFLDEAKGSVSTAHGPRANQRASAMFFNWLPIGGSVLPVVLAVYVHSLGLALTDAVVAMLIAIFAAFATTTIGALAGKRAGLPTFLVSRATFGVFGARIPAAFFALLKLVTASVIVLLLVIASQNAVSGWSVEGSSATRWQIGPVSVALWQLIIGSAVVLVSITSFIRLRYVKFLNLAVGIIACLGVIAALAFELTKTGFGFTFYYLESWPKTFGAATIVFAALGTVWSSSGADFASSLGKQVKGIKVFAWSSLSLFLVPGAIATAALIVVQSTAAKTQLLGFASIVPSVAQPYAYGVFAAVALLLAAIELRSTRLASRSLNSKFGGVTTQVVLAVLFIGLSLAGWHFYSSQGLLYNLKDYALVLSVPVAAWLGIFSADTLLRRIAYHEISLTRSYGFYGNYNLANLGAWLIATAAGLGMISSALPEFEWVGFLSKYSAYAEFLNTTNLGVAAAFGIGALFPLCIGIPRIKRQEAEVLSIESRRYELRDVLVPSESEPSETGSIPAVTDYEV